MSSCLLFCRTADVREASHLTDEGIGRGLLTDYTGWRHGGFRSHQNLFLRQSPLRIQTSNWLTFRCVCVCVCDVCVLTGAVDILLSRSKATVTVSLTDQRTSLSTL